VERLKAEVHPAYGKKTREQKFFKQERKGRSRFLYVYVLRFSLLFCRKKKQEKQTPILSAVPNNLLTPSANFCPRGDKGDRGDRDNLHLAQTRCKNKSGRMRNDITWLETCLAHRWNCARWKPNRKFLHTRNEKFLTGLEETRLYTGTTDHSSLTAARPDVLFVAFVTGRKTPLVAPAWARDIFFPKPTAQTGSYSISSYYIPSSFQGGPTHIWMRPHIGAYNSNRLSLSCTKQSNNSTFSSPRFAKADRLQCMLGVGMRTLRTVYFVFVRPRWVVPYATFHRSLRDVERR